MKKSEEKWYRNKDIVWLLVYGGALLIAIGVFYLIPPALSSTESVEPSEKKEKADLTADCEYQSPLDGVCLENKDSMTLRPFGVMVENNIDARPVSGIDQASIVFEAVAEGAITRFLAIFPGMAEVSQIGPVRSARPYYINWAEEFDAVYAHVGGSPQALDQLGSAEVKNLDQFYNGRYFWRSADRYAPHNVYTSTELLRDARRNNEWDDGEEFDAWPFKDDADKNDRPISQSVTVHYNAYNYDVIWEYDPLDNGYLRFQSGKIYRTLAGQSLSAKNVVVVYAEVAVIDDYGRLRTQTVGSGQAVLFQDGLAKPGVWKKESNQDRLSFFDESGEEFQMNRGRTWINIVPDNYQEAEYQ
ncbi:MAG TPA: DUF3048 domain-containing protein [Candidatus Bipolaricaulota bacterium]|nr:DUF3048 domain-containing protein [Candidatus Bipolaricaulota bacterium]